MFDGLDKALATGLILLVATSIAFGMFLMWVIPIVWGWVKPFIHAVTA